MSHTPNYDAKIKPILDALAPGKRTCAITGEKWMMTDEEIKWYRHFNVPPATQSLVSRLYRVNGMAVGFEWWWNKHAETGKPILTYVHPATGIKVLPDKEWLQKDFTSFARSYDASQSFFDQLLPLRKEVPLLATLNAKEPQNSIALICYGDVNSYFVLACQSKNSFYASDSLETEDTVESYAVKYASRCYRVVYGERLYNCRVAFHCFDCTNDAFLFDCRNCEDCFGATNQRNKKFIFFNQQLTEGEYRERMKGIDLGKRSVFEEFEQKFYQLMHDEGYWPENFDEKTAGCTGDYNRSSTDCHVCFMNVDGPRDNWWVNYSYGIAERNAMTVGPLGSDNYQSITILEGSRNLFSINMTRCFDVEYCMNCIDCEFCFGCIGLYKKRYCIFNQQYDEAEYWRRVDELKCAMLDRGEYGEFFPTSFTSQYFLESAVGTNLGATKEDEIKYGFPSFVPESAGAIGELGNASDLKDSMTVPDQIDDVIVDELAGVPLMDKKAGRRFAYLRPELEFYKAHRIALPTNHFIPRVYNLYHIANLFLLEDAPCAVCGKTLQVAKNMTFKDRKHLCREDYLKFLQSR